MNVIKLIKAIFKPLLGKSISFQIVMAYLVPTIILLTIAIFINSETARQQAIRNSEETSENFIVMVREKLVSEREHMKGVFHMLTDYLLSIDPNTPDAVSQMERTIKVTLNALNDAFAIWVAYEADGIVPGEIFFSCYIKLDDGIKVIKLDKPEEIEAFYNMNVHRIPFTNGIVWTEAADYWDYGLDITGRYFDAIGGPLVRDGEIIGVIGLDIMYDAFVGFISEFSIENERTILLINEKGMIVYSPDGYTCPLLGRSITEFISPENGIIVTNQMADRENFSIKGGLDFFEPASLMHFGRIPAESPHISQSLYIVTALNENMVYANARTYARSSMLSTMIGTIVVATFLLFTISIILKPIKRLTKSAHLIADGNFEVELGISGGEWENRVTKNEVYLLETALKKMLVQLSHIETIKELQELAEQSNKAKGIFLANMSHEIRTPMNVIIGISEMQLRNDKLPADALLGFEKICDSGTLLLNIINDILDFSKIEAGKLEIINDVYDIPSLINDTLQINRMRFESSNIEFVLQIDAETPIELIGDGFRLRQILNNLLSNAFKYTEEGEVILSVYTEAYASAEADEDDVFLVFTVQDTGYGMSSDQIEILFDEYTRFNVKANRLVEGTGLGMSITKRLIDLMDGEIIVESQIGVGSIFTVRIPQKTSGTAICGSELSHELQSFHFSSTSIAKRTGHIYEHMPYGKVLVVDDIESNLYVATCMLTPYRLQVETAGDGFEAVKKVKDGNIYDIIFMDHMMPGLNGIDAMKAIRETGYLKPIVALTANAVSGQEEIFIESGFDGFISKPIDSRELNQYLIGFIRNEQTPEVIEEARRKQAEEAVDNMTSELEEGLTPEMITFFLRDTEKALKVIEETLAICQADKDADGELIETFIISTHGMKSVLRNIGEPKLSEVALELELAGKAYDIAVIIKETPKFISSLKSLVEKYQPVCNNININLTGDDIVYLKDNMEKIKTACQSFDKKTIKLILDEIKVKDWPSHIKDGIIELEAHVLHSAFDKVKTLVDEIAGQARNDDSFT